MSFASKLHAEYVTLMEQYELKVERLVDRWIEIQVQMGKLNSEAIHQFFIPYEFSHDDTKLGFRTLDPEQDYYGAKIIYIPTAYFEDQTPYEEALKNHLEQVEKNKQSTKRRMTQQQVDSLERQLAQAKAQLAGIPKNG
jgi:hypothetical protein